MTEIRSTSPVKRETAVYYRGRPLIIEAHPGYVSVWCKRSRAKFHMTYAAILEHAMRVEVEAKRAERARAKKAAKKKGRR